MKFYPSRCSIMGLPDVYKRQDLDGKVDILVAGVGTGGTVTGTGPVSYTHLDVYKRQEYGRWGKVELPDRRAIVLSGKPFLFNSRRKSCVSGSVSSRFSRSHRCKSFAKNLSLIHI